MKNFLTKLKTIPIIIGQIILGLILLIFKIIVD